MGRKMKSIIALLVVLVLIYCQQLLFANAAEGFGGYQASWCNRNAEEYGLTDGGRKTDTDKALVNDKESCDEREPGDGKEVKDTGAEDIEAEDTEDKDTEDENKENGDTEDEDKNEGDGEDGEEGDGDKEDKDEIECFLCQIPPEDGQNGYYISMPEVKIMHVGKNGVTKYRFTDGNGFCEEGELNQDVSEVEFEKERFQEGENRLQIWMEDEEGKLVEEYVFEKVFRIDTKAPAIRIQTPRGLDTWYQKEVFISVSGEDGDSGSQVKEIACFVGNQKIGESREEAAGFRIAFASAGGNAVPVTVSVKDEAGNYARETFGLHIDYNAPQTALEGIQDYLITSQPVEVKYRAVDDNLLGQVTSRVTREDPTGQVSVMKAAEWEISDAKGSAGQLLCEDGVYQLYVYASDQAGYESSNTAQIIIDSENPVIRHVDEMNGKYLKSFCWEYPVEEVVQDFTSYTYSIALNGKPYRTGERVTREGRHILEISAVDSAGNKGTARAEFVVDHTAPEVVFMDIEDGGNYEEEKIFQAKLREKEDTIEEIRVNGEVQKIETGIHEYQFHIKECRDYEVSVKAYDKAGNQAVSRIHFTVGEKKTLLQKLASPIKKILINDTQSKKEEKETESSVLKGEKKNYGNGIRFVLAGMAAGSIAFVIKKVAKKRVPGKWTWKAVEEPAKK